MYFTKSELRVILFLTVVLAGGLAVKYFRHISESKPPFDYSATDEEFRKKSLGLRYGEDTLDYSIQNAGSLNDSIRLKSGSGETDPEEIEIDINKATKEELMDLPGIGESIALRIIEYREKQGMIKSTDELMNVSGIGRKKFGVIKNHIKVQNHN